MARKDNRNVSEDIKDTAGAAFHSIHKGLEATENAAMNAVDATAEAIRDVTEDNKNRRD